MPLHIVRGMFHRRLKVCAGLQTRRRDIATMYTRITADQSGTKRVLSW